MAPKKTWQKTGKTIFFKKLRESRGISEIIKKDDRIWQKAFDKKGRKQKVIICADERVVPIRGEFKIGIAGQLILASNKDKQDFIQRWKGKIKTIRSHNGCGAAAIAYGKLSLAEKNKFIEDVQNLALEEEIFQKVSQEDLYGAYHSYQLARELDADFQHLLFSKMRGPEKFHDARMIFWSADPTFDPANLPEEYLPPHFLANGLAFGLGEEYCLAELKILTGIALGHHGFGDLFNKKDPFFVVCVGIDKNVLAKVKQTLSGFGNRVYVST